MMEERFLGWLDVVFRFLVVLHFVLSPPLGVHPPPYTNHPCHLALE